MLRAAGAVIATLVLAGCSGPAPQPPSGACTAYTPDRGGGRYGVGEAGTVEVYRERDVLVLVGVWPSEGWQHEILRETDGELEIEFSRPGQDSAFRVQIEDDAIVGQWCR